MSSAELSAAPYYHLSTSIETNSQNAGNTQTLPVPDTDIARSKNVQAEAGIDFQNLLDNLSPSASTAPSGPVVTATTSSPGRNPVLQEHEQPLAPPIPDHTYASSAGLPPRPPTQASELNSNYPSVEDSTDYHRLLTQASNSSTYVPQTQVENQFANVTGFAPGIVPGTSSGANGLPPPPLATFQQHQAQQKSNSSPEVNTQLSQKSSKLDRYSARPSNLADDEAPWGPEVQKIYDEFLREERVYVTEGLWDRFPSGSRLFVGEFLQISLTRFQD